jgi:hypothetical protein
MITRVNTQPDTAPAWREAAAFAASKGWTIPQSLVVAALRTVDRNSLLDVRYATTLSENGASMASTCSAIMAGMDQSAIRRRVNGVTRFVNDLLPVMDLASGHGLDALDAAPALPAPENPGTSLLTRVKLSRIDAMQRAGALTPAQATSLRAAMATQNAHDPLAAEIQRRSAWKTDTYQMAMATGSFGFWTYAVADPVFALGMVALQSALITPINDAIEAGWSSIVPSLALSAHRFTLPSIGAPCQS